MKFSINRKTWRCGGNLRISPTNTHGKGKTKLLNDCDYMCCLGHFCLNLGLEKKELLNVGNPFALKKHVDGLNYPIGEDYDKGFSTEYIATIFTEKAIAINDNPYSTLQQKEENLTTLCKEYGHTLEFVGEYEND